MSDPTTEKTQMPLVEEGMKQMVEEKKQEEMEVKNRILGQVTKRYYKYFKHWRDFDMLTSILAMIGLVLAIFEYE